MSARASVSLFPAGGERAGDFFSDVTELRRRARADMQASAARGAAAPPAILHRLLNTALATELVCGLRYRRHHATARAISAHGVAQVFLQHAREEQEHAEAIARRIAELGGAPEWNPHGLATRSHGPVREGGGLPTMLREDLIAERIVIQAYAEMLRYIGDEDPETRHLLEDLRAQQETHARGLVRLLERLGAADTLAAAAAG
ncbi:MAG TPA: ferritin-like domain-containing protein [Methylomirabilota bacterium]|nr:ferritin-like domain-containing protein [Methylomirabilota bacterium]